MEQIRLKVGDEVRVTKTFSESDVYVYAGITGDQSPYHVNESFCEQTPFRTRRVQEGLVFSLANTLSSALEEKSGKPCLGIGFDEIRFLRPVAFGETITGVFTVDTVDETRRRVRSRGAMYDRDGEKVLTCVGILKVLDDQDT